ncbi:nuclear transport factor 2 family protein [Hyphomonas sp.]|uniref:nuclear transport factor 2 family protein n=2 Tax=Hyphomonas sp. TaxID=87 RepID=UPI0030020CD3
MHPQSDEMAIRSLAAAYTDAANRRDGAGMAAVYAPDGQLEAPSAGDPVVGREKLEKRFRRLVELERDFLFQMTHSGVVQVNGDRAMARWWFTELKQPSGQPVEWVCGVYQDECVRLDIGWRFARRVVSSPFRWVLPEGQDINALLPSFLPISGLPTA